MLRSPFAEFVPLPEVGAYTDDRIVVGQLGLPVGFDESKLELNVSGLLRVATVAGLGSVSIAGVHGKHDQESFSVSGMGSDGSIVAGGLRTVRKAPLHLPGSTLPHTWFVQYYRHGELNINTSSVEDSIKADGRRWQRGLLDPKARAHYINRGLQGALWHAGVESHRPRKDDLLLIPIGIMDYFITEYFMVPQIPDEASFLAVTAGLLSLQLSARSADKENKEKLIGEPPPMVNAIVPGMAIERIPLAGIMAYATKMIRAKPNA